jgi:hypothetical protein
LGARRAVFFAGLRAVDFAFARFFLLAMGRIVAPNCSPLAVKRACG